MCLRMQSYLAHNLGSFFTCLTRILLSCVVLGGSCVNTGVTQYPLSAICLQANFHLPTNKGNQFHQGPISSSSRLVATGLFTLLGLLNCYIVFCACQYMSFVPTEEVCYLLCQQSCIYVPASQQV